MRRIALLMLLALAGCGDLASDGLSGQLLGQVKAGATAAPAAASMDPRKVLTRALIEQSPREAILAVLTGRDVAATLSRAGQNGATETWMTADGIALILRQGLLVGTRGLGDDLMGVAAQPIGAGPGVETRIHDYLSGTDEIVRVPYQCRRSVAGSQTIVIFERAYLVTRTEETCTGAAGGFTNVYWTDSAGKTWKSRQFVSASIGYVEIFRL